jgi:hypothetical protein
MRRIGKILYCNDGDWVESCTALAEDQSGKLEIIHWTDLEIVHAVPNTTAVLQAAE